MLTFAIYESQERLSRQKDICGKVLLPALEYSPVFPLTLQEVEALESNELGGNHYIRPRSQYLHNMEG